tara:strand:+ start:7506 stop:8174 length:669 start_codon:yes stop_codon:yes gene_type:complete
MKYNLEKLEKRIGLKFKNKKLFERSLTHKSLDNDFNNEKLEFLGDRVIGLILSKKLYDLYPNVNEGILDKKFAKMVNRKTCCSISWNIGLQHYIRVSIENSKITKKDEKILSDACEALIGFIYIDQGYEKTKDVVLKLWKNEIKSSNITILDSKTKLQEYSLKKFKKLPVYKLLSSKGPKHNPEFRISVSIYGSKQFIGVGNSKQKAEQNCAEKLLKNINIV